MEERQADRFHWGWVATSATLGLALLGMAHVADLIWEWPEVTTGVISSVGAAFLLAFVLFLFERRFTRGVAAQVRDVAEAVVSARTDALGTRLEDLEARLDTHRATTEASQDEKVEAIADEVSFNTLSSALTAADRAGAIRDGSLTVPGSRAAPLLAVEFTFAPRFVTRGDGLVLDDGSVPKLSVQVEFARRPNESWSPVVAADWEPESTSVEIGSALHTQLLQRDRLAEAKSFDFALAIRNLQAALKLALDNQRVPSGEEKFHGVLHEMVTDEWVVTSAGLENVRTGDAISRGELGFETLTYGERPPAPPAPDGDQATWEHVLYRAGTQPTSGLFG